MAAREGSSEKLLLTSLYVANPILGRICQRGNSPCSQSACYRVSENTAYCRLLFLFQGSFLFIPFCAECNKQNRKLKAVWLGKQGSIIKNKISNNKNMQKNNQKEQVSRERERHL